MPPTALLPMLRHVSRSPWRSDCVSSYDEYRRSRWTDRDAYVGQFRLVGIAHQLSVRASLRAGVHPNPAADRQFHTGHVPPREEGMPAHRSTKMPRPSWEHRGWTRPRRGRDRAAKSRASQMCRSAIWTTSRVRAREEIGVEPRLTLAGVPEGERADIVAGWRRLARPHKCLNTIGCGLRTVEDHIAALPHVLAGLRSVAA